MKCPYYGSQIWCNCVDLINRDAINVADALSGSDKSNLIRFQDVLAIAIHINSNGILSSSLEKNDSGWLESLLNRQNSITPFEFYELFNGFVKSNFSDYRDLNLILYNWKNKTINEIDEPENYGMKLASAIKYDFIP